MRPRNARPTNAVAIVNEQGGGTDPSVHPVEGSWTGAMSRRCIRGTAAAAVSTAAAAAAAAVAVAAAAATVALFWRYNGLFIEGN